ncbi:hypothetical protein [Bradyrhizobium monzae]|uniref:hypothetical protein n=1 Tax=Bradyrhizobium sp. Oc8 TaxID=2876780 RepID=UPI001F30DF0F|nr:hypothetical protein [Bradyrhizobium sp. Oc8]
MRSIFVALLLVLPFAQSSSVAAAPVDFGAACDSPVTNPDANAIVHEVFDVKTEELAKAGLLPPGFWERNKDYGFAICDNPGSYDANAIYGKGVMFDYGLVVFLFAQARALILGRYISAPRQFDVFTELVARFADQGPDTKMNPFQVLTESAVERGVSPEEVRKTVSDPAFQKREQTLMLVTMYFLSMHERCHIALDHGTRLAEINKLPEPERAKPKQDLEIEADRCALDIINKDESRFKSSPVSFFGVLVVIATQAVVSSRPALSRENSHPSTRARLKIAKARVLEFIGTPSTQAASNYAATISATADLFDTLLAKLEVAQ